MELETVIILGLLLLSMYLLPSIVACARGHKDGVSIFVLNIFLGWTLVGWVCALAWACTGLK